MNMSNNKPESIEDNTIKNVTPPKSSFKEFAIEIAKFAVLSLIIVVPIRMYIASPFIVNGSSMEPTFETGDYIIVDQLSYELREPRRGEVVVFRYPKHKTIFFIKRIIGLPGETININNGTVTIKNSKHKDGFKINEPYIEFPKYDNFTTTLKKDEYFVMGDNRNASMDSRVWGPLKKNLITGRPLVRLFPLNEINSLPGEFKY